MRRIRKDELKQATRQMVEIFFNTPDISIITKGLDQEKAKKAIYENFYWDMVYYYKYGNVFTYDDEFSGIVFLIDGKKFSFIKMAILSLKSGKKTKKILNKEEFFK